jgi:hypothetical protein
VLLIRYLLRPPGTGYSQQGTAGSEVLVGHPGETVHHLPGRLVKDQLILFSLVKVFPLYVGQNRFEALLLPFVAQLPREQVTEVGGEKVTHTIMLPEG